MEIKETKYLTSAVGKSGFLETSKPVVAVSGRSNVGKSSFINMLAGRNKLARISQTPGRTRMINYFDFGEFILADLPGYGFAQVSKAEKDKWGKLLDDFFEKKESLNHVFALVDIRHKPSAEDVQMINYLYYRIIPFTIVATKADKIGKSRVKTRIRELAAELKVGESDIIAVSSVEKTGKDKILSKLDSILDIHTNDEDISLLDTNE